MIENDEIERITELRTRTAALELAARVQRELLRNAIEAATEQCDGDGLHRFLIATMQGGEAEIAQEATARVEAVLQAAKSDTDRAIDAMRRGASRAEIFYETEEKH